VRLSTLVLGFLVSVAGAVGFVAYRKATEEHRVWRALLALEGGDLHSQSAGRALFDRAVARLPRPDPRVQGPSPWRVVRLGGHVLLIEADILVAVPDTFDLVVHAFGEEGNHLSSASFSGGWRIVVNGAQAAGVAELRAPLLRLDSFPESNGRDVARQYYAVVRDRLVLVRLEDSEGRALENHYAAPNHTIGPRPPERTSQEWEEALESNDPVSILEVLVWLGGGHAPAFTDPDPRIHRESRAEADLVHAVRTSLPVRARVAELESSPNAWVRDAALLAAKALPK